MAKKTGKMLFWGLVIGAAAAGTYHYLQNKGKAATADEFDDFDNFDDVMDDTRPKDRHYVPLNLDNAKAFVSDTIDKAKEAVSRVSKKLQKEDIEDDVIIDEIFDDSEETAEKSAETSDAKQTADASEDATASEDAASNASEDALASTEDFFDDGQ